LARNKRPASDFPPVFSTSDIGLRYNPTPEKKPLEGLIVSPKRAAQALLVIAVCLLIANVAGQFSRRVLGHGHLFGLIDLFDADAESTVPAWYSSSTLLLCSFVIATIAWLEKAKGAPFVPHWAGLSLVFLFLSLDEALGIHERTIGPLRPIVNAPGGVGYSPWVIPYAAFALLVALAYLRFLAHLSPQMRRLFLLAGALYVGGAAGMEVVGSHYILRHSDESMTYVLLATIEELLEMLGVVIFIYALLSYLAAQEVCLRIRDVR
jgi:hypothetical protein